MKRIGLILMFLLLSQAAFAADNTGFYLGVSGGYVIPQDMTASDPDSGTKFGEAKLKNGYLAGVKAGWNTPFTKNIMAMELEYNYLFGTDPDDADFGDGNVTINTHALLLNFKARYPEGKFHPYAGFGVGYSYLQLSGPGEDISGSGLAYQFLAGLDFDITTNLGVGVGYKYFVTTPRIGSNGDMLYADVDYKASIVTVGLTYTF